MGSGDNSQVGELLSSPRRGVPRFSLCFFFIVFFFCFFLPPLSTRAMCLQGTAHVGYVRVGPEFIVLLPGV